MSIRPAQGRPYVWKGGQKVGPERQAPLRV